MLDALLTALRSFGSTDQVTDQVSDQVARLLKAIKRNESLSATELMNRLNLKHRASFRTLYLVPALQLGCIAMSAPDSPRSPAQRYRLTDKGRQIRQRVEKGPSRSLRLK